MLLPFCPSRWRISRRSRATRAASACPRFVRVVAHLEITATLKILKARLRAEGADPGRTGDPIYRHDPDARAYVPMDMGGYARFVVADARGEEREHVRGS